MVYLTTDQFKQMESYQKMVDEIDEMERHVQGKSELVRCCHGRKTCDGCAFEDFGYSAFTRIVEYFVDNPDFAQVRNVIVKKMDEIDPDWAERD